MLNRYSKGSILLKKNITRKGYRFETNYEFPLSYNDTEITITLSNMTLSDCAACYHLGEQLFEFSPSLSRTFDKYVVIGCYSSASEYCFVAKHDDRIIGFLLGSIIEKSNSNYGYLNWVAVEPSYQRKGVGTVMVDFIEKKMVEEDKIEMILVDTPKTNIKAIRFLEQFGFTNPTEQVYLTYTFSNVSSVSSAEHSLLTSISTSSIPTLSFTPAINHQHNGNHSDMPGSSSSSHDSATSADESNRTLLQKRKELENGDTNGHTNTTHSSEEEKNPPKSVKLDEFATPHPPSSSIPPRTPLSDEIIIRPINLDDIWPVFLVGEMAFTSQRPNLYRFWDESQVLDAYETDSDLSLVAEYKGEIVGFALGSTLERADTKFGYLIWLGVSTALQGRNIGRKLYNEYEKLIRKEGINTIIVDTQSTNVDAIRFFERIGFRVQEEFYYYSKSLKQPDEDELNSESSVTSTTSD